MRMACAALVLMAGAAQAGSLPPDLAKAAADFDQAQMHGDKAALERLLADDYRLVNSHGAIEDKAQFIADLTAPDYHLDPYTVKDPIERVWNDGAVLAGLVLLKGRSGGKDFQVLLRFADIWAKRDGHWQVMFTEVTAMPKPHP